ncbi:hypothetical protein [Terrimonas alba]|uniref:hypothetical protein n=1 Tax=Terrimonas alba TaxID=3349636 RepID=UPI0036D7CD1E
MLLWYGIESAGKGSDDFASAIGEDGDSGSGLTGLVEADGLFGGDYPPKVQTSLYRGDW